jgi:hybrid cluster-associated redox disulfide protein
MVAISRKGTVMSEKITKDMKFSEILAYGQPVIQVFMKYKMGCLGCAAARYETLEQGATAHGVDVEALLKDLNAVIKN